MHAVGSAPPRDEVRKAGAGGVLTLPLRTSAIVDLLDASRPHVGDKRDAPPFGTGTSSVVARRLGAELRDGLVRAVQVGADRPVPVGYGSELLALIWTAIGRTRALASEHASGRVEYDPIGPFGAQLLVLSHHDDDRSSGAGEISLRGVRALVISDDDGFARFASSVLREAGAETHASTGEQDPLEAAAASGPDVILTDPLTSRGNAIAFCREAGRVAALLHVPVLLTIRDEVSARRIRDTVARGGSNFRKRPGGPQILRAVRGVLVGRARLLARLDEPGEVSGLVDDVGVPPLLEAVAARRPNAEVRVDAGVQRFVVRVASGCLAEATRSSRGGTLGEGREALTALLQGHVDDAEGNREGAGLAPRGRDEPQALHEERRLGLDLLGLHVLAVGHTHHLLRTGDQPFGEQEAERQLLVVPRGAHGDAQSELLAFIQRPMAEADLEGFLGDQDVLHFPYLPAFVA